MKKLITLVCLGMLTTMLMVSASFGQSAASVTWSLIIPDSLNVSAAVGNVTGLQAAGTDSFLMRSYSGTVGGGPGPLGSNYCRWNPGSSYNWGPETGENAFHYVQFVASPTAGNKFTVDSISFWSAGGGTSGMRAFVYYSTDPTFTTKTRLTPAGGTAGDTLLLLNSGTAGNDKYYSFAVGTTINAGQSIYVRMYPWYTGTASTSKYFYTQLVAIKGSTTSSGGSSSTLFSQTFSTAFADIGGTVVNTAGLLVDPLYVSVTSPSTSQFSAVATSASGNGVSHVSCDGTGLIFARQGGGSGWAVQDGGAAFGSGVGAAIVKFDFTPQGMLKTSTKVGFTFMLGATTSADQTSGPAFASAATNATAFITVGATLTDTFYVNNGNFNSAAPFAPLHTGKVTITYAVNNSTSGVTYTDPTGASQSLAAGMTDLWVDNTKESAGVAVASSANAITGFKLGLGNTGGNISTPTSSTIKVSNLSITKLGTGGTGVQENMKPDNFSLAQNYPNPFNPATQISYSIAKASFVSLKVYNLIGQEVATLVSNNQTAGRYTVPFNASGLSSGVYLYRLQAGSSIEVKRMMLVK
ncbi:MAG: T9SS C-terminal target domain-containing protein [Ignavibacteriae bacterium]|nr:MAG: T9SS C-terminal target domain-containing protein [Ignavibacteriota bacterium]